MIFFSQASQRLRLEQFLGICGEDIHIFQMILELSAVIHWCRQLPGRKEWHGLFWFPNHSSIFLTLETPNRKKSHLRITLQRSSTIFDAIPSSCRCRASRAEPSNTNSRKVRDRSSRKSGKKRLKHPLISVFSENRPFKHHVN